ncbi:MAG TPA: hypothetical protein VEX43_05980 [Chthoniobacterales bacterium]|nr:hypothetical protein [Chthoniobacterales bacterium]
MNSSKIIRFLSAAALVAAFSTLAHAQSPRTWVSGTGDDQNPCSRTAPCKTFAGAQSKTATGGEISVLDPGGFGGINITKSLTLNGDGTLAGILASGLATGITVNITTNLTTDKVVVRNVSIQGAGTGTDGVRFLDGAELILDNVTISGFTDAGVDASLNQSSNLFLKNVRISKAGVGVRTQTTSGTVSGAFENVAINGITNHGVECLNNTILALRNLQTSRCGLSGVRSSAATVDVSIENSVSSGNNIGYEAPTGAGPIRIANCGMYYNNTNCSPAVLSAGNNRSAGNTTTNNPTPNGMTTH